MKSTIGTLLVGACLMACGTNGNPAMGNDDAVARGMDEIRLGSSASMVAQQYLHCITKDTDALEGVLAGWLADVEGVDDAKGLAASAMDSDWCGYVTTQVDDQDKDAAYAAAAALDEAGIDVGEPLSSADQRAQTVAIDVFEGTVDGIITAPGFLFEYVELVGPNGERICIYL